MTFKRARRRGWIEWSKGRSAGNNQLRNTACGTWWWDSNFYRYLCGDTEFVPLSGYIQIPSICGDPAENYESGDIAYASYKHVERLPYETENFFRVPTGPGSCTRFGGTKAARSPSAAAGVSRPGPEGSHPTLLLAPRLIVVLAGVRLRLSRPSTLVPC